MAKNKQYSIVWEINSLEGESPLYVAKNMLQSNIEPKLKLNNIYYLLGDDAVHIYCKDGLL